MKKMLPLVLVLIVSACNDPETSSPNPSISQPEVNAPRAEEAAEVPPIPETLQKIDPEPRPLPPSSEPSIPLDIGNEAGMRGEKVVLNPSTLRKLLLEGNTSILLSANRLHKAKDQLAIARGNLLPSISLAALLPGPGGAGFFGASVDFLLPFLVPSRWFEYGKAKALLEAEKQAFLLMELNQYASIYSLYFSYVNDLDLREALLEEVSQFELIERSTEVAYQFNKATDEELKQAWSQTALARIRVTRINELIRYERALLRHALAIESDRPIEIERFNLSETEWEAKSVEQVVEAALARAPEAVQLHHLKNAAKKEKWSKIFGFINGFSLGSMFGGGSSGFGSMTGAGSINFGFAYFPNIRLSERNSEEIELRSRELRLELVQTVEAVLGRLVDAKRRLDAASRAELHLKSVFETKRKRYEIADESFTAVLFARSQMREATIERLRTMSELNSLRVSLERAMILSEFERIKGCPNPDLSKASKKKGFSLFGWLRKGDDSSETADWASVEKACATR